MSKRAVAATLAAAVVMLAALGLAAWLYAPVAAGATTLMDGKPWLAAQTEITGPMNNRGTWAWRICAITQRPCPAGDIPSFGSWWKLRYAIAHPAGRTTFFLDQEGWTWTPRLERQHPLYYLKVAGQYATAHHVTLFEAPVITGRYVTIQAKRAAQLRADETAAAYASGVDMQDQWASGQPATYAHYAYTYAHALRAAAKTAHKTVIILDNLATDPGGQVVGGTTATAAQSAAILHQSYEAARPYVDGFWFEAPVWKPPAAVPSAGNCMSTGCPDVAAAFLTLIGA